MNALKRCRIIAARELRTIAKDQSLLLTLLLAPLHAQNDEPDLLYSYIQQTQHVKSVFEVDRLLYVAATRAKKRLH